MNEFDIVKAAVKILDKRKAMDIMALEITDTSTIGDYFIIATATSNTHVKSLAGEVEDTLTEAGIEPGHIEGRATGWILLDYGSVIIHLFTADSREYYNLERLWEDAKQIDLTEIFEENKAELNK